MGDDVDRSDVGDRLEIDREDAPQRISAKAEQKAGSGVAPGFGDLWPKRAVARIHPALA
jgi:hypothetical protein